MNFLKRLALIITIGLAGTYLQAADVDLPPLKIGMESFAPPYVVVGVNNIYGFDADMINTICKKIGRRCQYMHMPFSELITNTANGTVDMSLSGMAITAERARYVNFSLPYLMLYHSFLTTTENAQQPFSFNAMNESRIGYEADTILADLIGKLPIKNSKIIAYKHIEDEILALSNGELNYAFLDTPTALYWQNNSAGVLSTFGEPIASNMALGIAINPKEPELLAQVNQALKEYLNDGGFKINYDRYLVQFSTPNTSYKINE